MLKNERETLTAIAKGLLAGDYPQFDMADTDTCIGGLAYRLENPDTEYWETEEAVKSVRDSNKLFWPTEFIDNTEMLNPPDLAADAIDRYLAGNTSNPWLL